MAKRDQDSTMEMSLSQLVVPKPPPTSGRMGPPANTPANDRSVWGQLVVGADDFAPVAKRPDAPVQSKRGLVLAILGVIVLAAGAFAVVWVIRTSESSSSTPSASATPVATPPLTAPPPNTEPAKAGSAAVATPDPAATPATAQSAEGDAASAVAAPTAVDAISGVAPVLKAKKASKKRSGKKTTTKKRVTRKRR